MKDMIKKIAIMSLTILFLPHIILLFLNITNGGEIREDIEHYKRRKGIKYGTTLTFVYLMIKYPEFRNIFFMRVGPRWKFILFWFPPMSTLHIWTPSSRIGGGLYIGHGWGTVINAHEIGRNCLVGQNCTIGSRNRQEPVLEDNVSVWAHAVVIGNITICKGSQIGAGAVVVKSVPENSVVVPPKSMIIRQNENKCQIPL